MKSYDIWSEGYSITGSYGSAQYICTIAGESFKEACDNAYKHGIFENYGEYDSEHLSLWGCRLFDNEADARRSFG